jgi:signal transduction histidine kinase
MPLKLKECIILATFIVLGGYVAYIDHQLQFHTILTETIHALITTAIFIACLIAQKKYPSIKQFGWSVIVMGAFFLMLGSWIDILDDPPMLRLFQIEHGPFGRSWQQAFLKKIMGYSLGLGLMAYGFAQWIPWMIESQIKLNSLNNKLTDTTQKLNRLMRDMDERVESQRLSISRELHDDVAQQLTYLTFQLQLCQRQIEGTPQIAVETLKAVGLNLSETLKSVRQICQNLRPESLYALGLLPAIDSYLESLRKRHPQVKIIFMAEPDLQINLDDHGQLHVFRLIQEGTRNALKHSQAQHIQISLLQQNKRITLSIEDNGVGLPWDDLPSNEDLVRHGHLGLVGLKERVEDIEGSFLLRNRDDGGALMEVTIPA